MIERTNDDKKVGDLIYYNMNAIKKFIIRKRNDSRNRNINLLYYDRKKLCKKKINVIQVSKNFTSRLGHWKKHVNLEKLIHIKKII